MPGNKEDALESEIHREWRWYCEDDIRRRREWKRKTEVTQERERDSTTLCSQEWETPSSLLLIFRPYLDLGKRAPFPEPLHILKPSMDGFMLSKPLQPRESRSRRNVTRLPYFRFSVHFFSNFTLFVRLHSSKNIHFLVAIIDQLRHQRRRRKKPLTSQVLISCKGIILRKCISAWLPFTYTESRQDKRNSMLDSM